MIVGPCDTEPEKIKEINPDGILLSNGPGDPAASKYAIENIKKFWDIGQFSEYVWGIKFYLYLWALKLLN